VKTVKIAKEEKRCRSEKYHETMARKNKGRTKKKKKKNMENRSGEIHMKKLLKKTRRRWQ